MSSRTTVGRFSFLLIKKNVHQYFIELIDVFREIQYDNWNPCVLAAYGINDSQACAKYSALHNVARLATHS